MTAATEKVAYDLRSAAAAVDLSETYLRRAINAGHLRAKLIDRKYRIGHAALRDWFDSLPDA